MSYYGQEAPAPSPPPPEENDNSGLVAVGVAAGLGLLGGIAAALSGGGKPSPRGRFQGRRSTRPAKRCDTPCGR